MRFRRRPKFDCEMSQFGAGVVVCLAKFSEHLGEREREIGLYAQATDDDRARWEREAARYPKGDAAQRLAMLSSFGISESVRGSREQAISAAIELWMNAASDHFYDLDREKAPAPLIELADLALEIGHGFTGKTWTLEDVDRIRELWRESCLAVDRMLGSDPDWGEW